MFAQPSQSSETFTRYRDDVEPSGEPIENGAPSQGVKESSTTASPMSGNQRLLQEVLGETLIRNQENPDQLVQVLRDFKDQHRNDEIDVALFVLIAREVLRHRLGERARKLPDDLFDEVGRALWANQDSRNRIQRFWNSIGATS